MLLQEYIFNEACRYRALDFATMEADDEFVERIHRHILRFLQLWLDSLSWAERDKTGLCCQKLKGFLDDNESRLTDTNPHRLTVEFTLNNTRGFEVILLPKEVILRDYIHASIPCDEHRFSLEGFVPEFAELVSSSDDDSLLDTSSE